MTCTKCLLHAQTVLSALAWAVSSSSNAGSHCYLHFTDENGGLKRLQNYTRKKQVEMHPKCSIPMSQPLTLAVGGGGRKEFQSFGQSCKAQEHGTFISLPKFKQDWNVESGSAIGERRGWKIGPIHGHREFEFHLVGRGAAGGLCDGECHDRRMRLKDTNLATVWRMIINGERKTSHVQTVAWENGKNWNRHN